MLCAELSNCRKGTALKIHRRFALSRDLGFYSRVVLGVPLGSSWAGIRAPSRHSIPLIQILRPISPIAWIPVAILWFGVSDAAPIFLIFLASVFPITVATIAAVQNMQPVYLRAAQNFGLGRLELFHRVIFRASLPQIITGIRIALGVAWLVVVAAEMIAVNRASAISSSTRVMPANATTWSSPEWS